MKYERLTLRGVSALALLVSALLLAACGTPTPNPTPLISAPTVLMPFTPSGGTLELPTLLPTVTLVPTTPVPPSTQTPFVVTATFEPLIPTATRAAATVPPTRAVVRPTAAPGAPTSTRTLTPPPQGEIRVQITALRVDPPQPKPDVAPKFIGTFSNQSGREVTYNWCAEIWDPERTRNSIGITACRPAVMPPGVSEQVTTDWTNRGLGECKLYRTQAVWRDEDDARTPFLTPDGQPLWIEFTMCP